MKKLLSAAVAMLIAANTWAQTGDPAPRITYDTLPPMPDTLAINAARKGHFVFFDIGGGMNNVAFSVEDTIGKKNPGFGLTARFGYRYFFSPNWGIGAGLNYNTYQGITKINYKQFIEQSYDTVAVVPREMSLNEVTTIFDIKERITVSAIDIPIGLYYQRPLGSKFRFGAGVNVSFTQILTKKYKTTSEGATTQKTFIKYNLPLDYLDEYGIGTFSNFKGTPSFKTSLIGVGGEVSIHYALTSKLDLTFNLSGTYRFGNIKNRDDAKLWNEQDTAYHSSAYAGITQTQLAKEVNLVNVGATIGLRYRFAKKPQPQIIERVLPPIFENDVVAEVDTFDSWYNRNADDFGVNIMPMGYTFVNSGLEMTKQLERKQVGDPIGVPIHFALNSDQLADTSHTLMDTVVVFLKKNPDVIKMEVSAHTDNIGSDAYNLDLSKRRARTVVNYLIRQGVEPERVVAVGYGESRPLNDNSTDEMREINRRVEFVILALDETKMPKKKEDD